MDAGTADFGVFRKGRLLLVLSDPAKTPYKKPGFSGFKELRVSGFRV